MLLAPLPNYAGQPLVPPAKEPLAFVQQLHSNILAAVLPLWSHPQTCYAPTGIITSLVRVLQTCAQGPSHASIVLRYSQGRQGAQAAAAARAPPAPDAAMVGQIMEMGFSQGRAEEALRRVGVNSVELAMEWLFVHPEEPAAAAAAPAAGGAGGAPAAPAAAGGDAGAPAAASEADREEEELTRALLASLSVVGMSPDAVAQRPNSQQQQGAREAAAAQATDATIATGGGAESPNASTAHTGGGGPAAAATPGSAAAAAADLDDVTTPQATPASLVQPGAPVLGGMAPAAAVVGTAVGVTTPPAAAGGAAAAAAAAVEAEGGGESATTGIPAPAQLVDGAVHLVAASPSTAFSIADLLVTMAQCEEGKQRQALVVQVMDACLPPTPPSPDAAGSSAAAAAAAAAAAELPKPGTDVLTPARLLLLLLHKDPSSRKVAASKGLVQRSLAMLTAWQDSYCAAVTVFEADTAAAAGAPLPSAAAATLQVPVWVEAVLMLLDLMVTTQVRPSSRSGATAADAAARADEALARIRARAQARGAQARGAAGAAAGAEPGGGDVAMADPPAGGAAAAAAAAAEGQPAAAAAGGAAAAAADSGAAGRGAATAAAVPEPAAASSSLPPELAQLSGLQAVLDNWRPCGLLDEAQQQAATSVCLTLLQHLYQHADAWDQPDTSMFQGDGSVPNPGSITQALLQLLEHLTKRTANAGAVLAAGGHKLLLNLPAACLAPSISRQEGSIGAILRHLLEDPVTLEGWMEAEIKNSMAVKGMRDPYGTGRNTYNQANPNSK
jgi:hypothetical protein